MQLPLTLNTLGELDTGRAAAIVDQAIRTAMADLDDRGDDGKPREVNIKLILVRLDNGMVSAHVEANTKVPQRRTASTLGLVRVASGQPSFQFQTMSPDDPTQKTIDEV